MRITDEIYKSFRRDLDDALAYIEGKNKQVIIDSLYIIYRDFKSDDIRILLDRYIEENKLFNKKSKELLVLIVSIYKLLNLHEEFVTQLKESLENVVNKLPTNSYNIKNALESCIYVLDPQCTSNSILALELLHRNVMSTSNRHTPIYSKAELKEEYDMGFEQGYIKGLAEAKKIDDSVVNRCSLIDL